MQITFLGGADEVGASCLIIEMGGKRMLVDAGIRISPKVSRGLSGDQLPDLHGITEQGGVDLILVTHAHTDHTGALPLVLDQYPDLPVLATEPTIALTQTLLADAQRIMRGQWEAEGEIPMYDAVAAQRLLEAFRPVQMGQPFALGDDLQVTYYRAGHILGAAMLVLESSEGVLVISGDVSFSPQRTVDSAAPPRIKADALIMESTYGGRLHANRRAEERRLILRLKDVLAQGGKVLIPAFAIGRAQEVVQILLNHPDQISAPVYVDGMVRVVCDIYARFPDDIPRTTRRWAGEEPLFFRKNVKPIGSTEQRNEVARGSSPCIIVASSGMLTGGASVVYAREMVSNPLNAILLTGYQDEESPGRALQNAVEAKERGETPTLWLGGRKVKAACQIDTYSLSAHADEGELLGMAQTFDPERTFLVHGDGGARRSIADGMQVRELAVSRPSIGQTFTLSFAERPWIKARITQVGVGAGRPLDPEALWQAVRKHAGQTVTANELAQVWYGDMEQSPAVLTALHEDILYFAPDWRLKHVFTVRTEEDIQRALRRRAIMAAYPDLVGQVVVLRNVNGAVRIGIVTGQQAEAFEARVLGARGKVRSADELVWPLGPFEGPAEERMQALRDLKTEAEARRDRVLPPGRLRDLAEAGEPVNPADFGDEQADVLAAVLALLTAGAQPAEGGLLPTRLPPEAGVADQQTAQQIALDTIPEEARLRKVGILAERKLLRLDFDFPAVVRDQYGDAIDEVEALTGWQVTIPDRVNQQALGQVLVDLLPEGVTITGGPSYHVVSKRVEATLSDEADIAEAFERITGFQLVLDGDAPEAPTGEVFAGLPEVAAEPLEQNQARQVALASFPPDAYLDKVGMNIASTQLVLYFAFPMSPARYAETIREVARRTGWTVTVAERINQQKLGEVINELLPEGAALVKGPSYYLPERRAEVAVSGLDDPQALADAFRDVTGFRLTVDSAAEAARKAKAKAAPPPPTAAPANGAQKMEINAAYGVIRHALTPHGLVKAGAKGGVIVLSFITPEVGARCTEQIEALAAQTGWPLSLNPNPNPHALIETVRRIMSEAGLRVTKGPGLHTDERMVSVTVAPEPTARQWTELRRTVEEATGYRLVPR